ncbi:MAG: hypothetical protein V4534_00920 [Myxococcota bacterium]
MGTKRILILLSGVWLVLMIIGLSKLWEYSAKPGSAAQTPQTWPQKTTIPKQTSLDSLVIFAHPDCPCSYATVGELNEILAQVNHRLDVHVLFVTPKNPDANWTQTRLWRAAKAIPGVSVSLDENGVESRRFGAKTSGQVNLYDPQGRLVFSGGITSARGHSGDNAGKSAIVSFINERKTTVKHTPVFGCVLYEGHETTIL